MILLIIAVYIQITPKRSKTLFCYFYEALYLIVIRHQTGYSKTMIISLVVNESDFKQNQYSANHDPFFNQTGYNHTSIYHTHHVKSVISMAGPLKGDKWHLQFEISLDMKINTFQNKSTMLWHSGERLFLIIWELFTQR